MDEEIYEIYKEVEDKCSKEEFLNKIEECRVRQSHNTFIDEKSLAKDACLEFKGSDETPTVEVQSYIKPDDGKLKDLEPGEKEKNIIGRVMIIGNPKGFTRKGKPGRVCNIEIEDDTAKLRVTLWSENIKLLKNINEGEIIQINNVDIKEGFRGGLEATCKPRTSMIHLNDEDFPEFPKYVEEITNIEDIKPENEVNVIARVVRVSNIRTYEKDGKEGKVATLDIQDASGKTSYTLWNKNTDLIKTLELDVGDSVKILKARARERNGEISLTHWDGSIKKGDYDVPDFSEELVPIADVRETKNVSVLGIVTKIQDPISFTRKTDGSEGQVKSIEIKDDTGSVKVTLWNDNTKLNITKGDILKVSGGDGEFDDYSESGYRINTNWNTSFKINPTVESPLADYFNACKEEMGPIPLSQIQEIDDDGIEVDVMGRIITSNDIYEFQRDDGEMGLVRSLDFSDGEAVVQLSFWGDRAKETYELGDAYLIENARTKLGMYSVDLNIGRTSRVIKLTEDEARYLPSFETIEKSIYDYKSICDVDEDDHNIILVGRVIESNDVHEFQRDDGTSGFVKNIEIADNSGTIRVTLWGEDAKKDIEIGKAIKIQNPSIRYNEDHLEVNISRNSSILDPSENELNELPTYDELKESIYQPKLIDELEDDDTNVIVTGEFADPVGSRVLLSKCPHCNFNLEFSYEDEIICDNCGEVVNEPKYLLMIPGKLVDDTGEISLTFFDKLAEELLGMTKEEIVEIIEETEDFGSLEGKVEDLNGITLEVLSNVNFDEYNEQIRLRPKKILNKYY